jgi:hypothetical protein
MSDTNVTALRRPAKSDRTNALRQRRFRQRRKQAASVTVQRNGTSINTIEMCALGARLKSGTVTLDDLRLGTLTSTLYLQVYYECCYQSV